MISGKTSTGFEFVIDEEKLNDMRFVDVLAETSENVLAFPKVIAMLLGAEQKAKLYEHLEEDGRVPIESVQAAVAEIMEASAKTKNS